MALFFQRTGGEGKGHFFKAPHNHFHLLYRHLDISRVSTAQSLPQDSNRQPLVSERKSLTTKLRSFGSVASSPKTVFVVDIWWLHGNYNWVYGG